jgi:ABC-type transporter Mla subunit MlaD
MSQGTNYWKLGLFVLVSGALALVALVVFGTRKWNDQSVDYISYFDESVPGLELGSPVKFRGVIIGTVSSIDVSQDQRHVSVTSELMLERLGQLKLGGPDGVALTVHPELRVQLAQSGITGVKFVQMDFFGENAPLPVLPFDPPKNYIPSTPSTLKSLESSVMKTADRFPGIAEDLSQTMAKMNNLMDSIEQNRLPQRGAAALDQAEVMLKEVNGQVRALDTAGLSASVKQSLGAFEQTLQRANHLIERLESDQGVISSAERAVQSLDEVARGSNAIGPELESTLREVRAAARSIRRFADTLERDPDMLLKGRAQSE